jgi:hypothetical protein
MDELAKHIERILKERAFCLVFEAELERCWPSEVVKREKEIQFFAESQGWTAVILTVDSGSRAIFRKLEQRPANYEGSSVGSWVNQI